MYLFNSTGIRYVILLTALPKLPRSIDLPADVPHGMVSLGMRFNGQIITLSWSKLGHLLIVGMTGSEKSSLLRSIAIQAGRTRLARTQVRHPFHLRRAGVHQKPGEGGARAGQHVTSRPPRLKWQKRSDARMPIAFPPIVLASQSRVRCSPPRMRRSSLTISHRSSPVNQMHATCTAKPAWWCARWAIALRAVVRAQTSPSRPHAFRAGWC